MECLFCGMDVGDMPYHRNGEVYCSKECADAENSVDDERDYHDYDNELALDTDIDDFEDDNF